MFGSWETAVLGFNVHSCQDRFSDALWCDSILPHHNASFYLLHFSAVHSIYPMLTLIIHVRTWG
jgi:hypothetical protein